jgi:hypothetical protein
MLRGDERRFFSLREATMEDFSVRAAQVRNRPSRKRRLPLTPPPQLPPQSK